MVAYRQPKKSSLRELLVKSKVPPARPKRQVKGMKKCNQPKCQACPFVSEQHKISANNFQLVVNKPVSCDSSNVVYCILCNKSSCKSSIYIGETKRKFRERFNEHLGYVRKQDFSQPTGQHFNLPGHSLSNMKISILEHCGFNSDMYRKTREEYFINKFSAKYKGLNKKM